MDNGRAGRGEGWFWTGQLQLLGLRLKSCSYLTTTLGLFQKPCTSYRIAVGFPDGIRVQAKSGSLMGRIRNEIGVVTYPDGRHYAIAVFTRSHKGASRQPPIDQAIGTVSALAIEHIRSL
ncbi:MAG TPA: serine hydrolase [Chloroflexia bacterium]|nr:serine hydrolase [Chloroflexia bacterium]